MIFLKKTKLQKKKVKKEARCHWEWQARPTPGPFRKDSRVDSIFLKCN
jgi:hypothetical protein